MLIPRLALIDSLQLIKLADVTAFDVNADGTVSITANTLPISIVRSRSNQFAYNVAETDSGIGHKVDITVLLKQELPQLGNFIFIVGLSTGASVVVGSPSEYPVYSAANNKDAYTLNIDHESRQKPFILA